MRAPRFTLRAGARGPHPSSDERPVPRVARGPGARASGTGKSRGDSWRAPSRGSRSSSFERQRWRHRSQLVEGVVSANRAGYGYLASGRDEGQRLIPPKEMNGVMARHRLKVKLGPGLDVIAWLGTVEGSFPEASNIPRDRGRPGRTAWVNAQPTAVSSFHWCGFLW